MTSVAQYARFASALVMAWVALAVGANFTAGMLTAYSLYALVRA